MNLFAGEEVEGRCHLFCYGSLYTKKEAVLFDVYNGAKVRAFTELTVRCE